jgi:hypothetical protein
VLSVRCGSISTLPESEIVLPEPDGLWRGFPAHENGYFCHVGGEHGPSDNCSACKKFIEDRMDTGVKGPTKVTILKP